MAEENTRINPRGADVGRGELRSLLSVCWPHFKHGPALLGPVQIASRCLHHVGVGRNHAASVLQLDVSARCIFIAALWVA